jgi:hypothetical protein
VSRARRRGCCRAANAPPRHPAGWELAQALLRPRSIEVDGDGGVTFTNDSSAPRISATQALRHRFLRRAADPLALALSRAPRALPPRCLLPCCRLAPRAAAAPAGPALAPSRRPEPPPRPRTTPRRPPRR